MDKSAFQDLRISGLHLERCHVASHPIIRIYLKLSARPPLGWSYIFTTTWNAMEYDSKPPAGVEDDAIWIECVLEELKESHLAQLENALEQANTTYRATQRQKALAVHSQKQLDRQTHALLEEFGSSLNASPNVPATPERERKSATQSLVNVLRKMFAPPK